jgi:hypothetical protein
MGRKRVEDKHPELVSVALTSAAAGVAQVYGVTAETVRAVLRRFFAEDLERQRNKLVVRVTLLEHELAMLRAKSERADQQDGVQLYGVQKVHDATHAAALLESGAALGTLAGVLVAVRPVHVHAGSPVHVHSGSGAVISIATVSAYGMAVANVSGLQDAGLPVPVLA